MNAATAASIVPMPPIEPHFRGIYHFSDIGGIFLSSLKKKASHGQLRAPLEFPLTTSPKKQYFHTQVFLPLPLPLTKTCKIVGAGCPHPPLCVVFFSWL